MGKDKDKDKDTDRLIKKIERQLASLKSWMKFFGFIITGLLIKLVFFP